MKLLNVLNEHGVPNTVKNALNHFFSKNISRALSGRPFPATSLAKRIVGNVIGNSFYLRNAATARDKYKRQKLDTLLRHQIQGAVKAMAVDHPEVMNFDHSEFVDRLMSQIVDHADDLYDALSYRD